MSDNKEDWVPLIRKTTVEEGLLFATQKDSNSKRTTTRTWEINKKGLPVGHEEQVIRKILKGEFEH